MRVYLPATLPLIIRWLADGVALPGGPAYAVTPALREWYREGDIDELEHVAQVAAAGGSVELIASDPTAPRRRVVLAADVADSEVEPMPVPERAAVRLSAPVPRSGWASALLDDAGAEVVVATAVANLARAAIGDEDARFALDEAAATELGWYGVQELPHVLGLD
ncbi:MAG TPA: hypothetical protein VHW92_03910 [Mycobacteriales bacterium]|jgi:hypothetical protein|nr:hypothetical protein [Mycobacteriales bacterium]